MALGIYMDNLSEHEDLGQEINVLLTAEFIPDFKNRHTIQLWKVSGPTLQVMGWKGSTLADDSAHEIFITNNTVPVANISFIDRYVLIDEESAFLEDQITLKTGEVAHFYCTAIYNSTKTKIMIMRTGTQDSRDTNVV